ncbi:MAG: hypothetical protein WD739_11610 [Actinomycetota bacterium]
MKKEDREHGEDCDLGYTVRIEAKAFPEWVDGQDPWTAPIARRIQLMERLVEADPHVLTEVETAIEWAEMELSRP